MQELVLYENARMSIIEHDDTPIGLYVHDNDRAVYVENTLKHRTLMVLRPGAPSDCQWGLGLMQASVFCVLPICIGHTSVTQASVRDDGKPQNTTTQFLILPVRSCLCL
jgi:hypothetical protein